MKKLSLLLFFSLYIILSSYNPCRAQDIPHEFSGFRLGQNISEVSDELRMNTALPLRHMEWINEVEIIPPKNYKSGLIWYGNCASPGRIVRIIMKYSDSSKKFYSTLLDKLKERYGEPDEWQGDAFRVVLSWKWSFKDKQGNTISMELQHNTQDPGSKMGNSIKLTMGNLMEEESECWDKKAVEDEVHGELNKIKTDRNTDWNTLLPH